MEESCGAMAEIGVVSVMGQGGCRNVGDRVLSHHFVSQCL